jgi:hypothetical protein
MAALEPTVTEAEQALIGSLVTGRVAAVFRWGVIVDLGLSHVGHIDPLYIDDDDHYEVDQEIRAYLTGSCNYQFSLRPPGQVPIAERLRRKGYEVEGDPWDGDPELPTPPG